MRNKDQIILEGLYVSIFESLKEGSHSRSVPIEDILPDKNNMEIAVDSLYKGMYSSDDKPLGVYRNKGKYILGDGHHRLLQYIIRGDASVNVRVLDSETPISRKGNIGLDLLDGYYYGLDSSLENGWLIKRI